jgi:WD40 repeat protein
MRSPGSRFALLVAGLLALGACSKETDSLVLVSVTATPPSATLTTLRITVGTTTRTFPLTGDLGSASQLFGVYVAESVVGTVNVTAAATGTDACNGYSGNTVATVPYAGATANVSLPLTPGNTCPADGPPVTQLTCTTYNHNATTGACTIASDPTTGVNDTVISDIAFSRDGKFLFTAGSDGRVKVWTWDGSTLAPEGTVFATTGFTYLAVSPDGKLLAMGSGGGDLSIRQIAPGWAVAATLTGLADNINSVAFGPDSQTLYAIEQGGFLDVFTSASMDVANSVPVSGTPYVIAASPAQSDSSYWLAIGYMDGTASLTNVTSAGVLGTEQPFDVTTVGATWAMQFAPDGKRLAVGADDGAIGVWPVPPTSGGLPLSPSIRITSNAINYVAFSSGGSELAIAAGDSTASRQLGIWNLGTGQQRAGYASITDRPYSVSFSADGTLAVGARDCGRVLICPSR